MRGLIAVSAFVVLSGCVSFAPLDEKDRTRIRVVAPAAAQFPPTVEFKPMHARRRYPPSAARTNNFVIRSSVFTTASLPS